MSNKTNSTVLLLEQTAKKIAETLGVAIETIFPFLTRQCWVEVIQNFILFFLHSIVPVVCLIVIFKFNNYDQTLDKVITGISGFFLITSLLFLYPVLVSLIRDSIQMFVNPTWQVLKKGTDVIRNKEFK